MKTNGVTHQQPKVSMLQHLVVIEDTFVGTRESNAHIPIKIRIYCHCTTPTGISINGVQTKLSRRSSALAYILTVSARETRISRNDSWTTPLYDARHVIFIDNEAARLRKCMS
jgi:hypothetical protein